MKTKMLITGGTRSGKSRFGQETAAKISPQGRVLYIATARVWDEEMAVRVKKHQDSRPASWDTYEGYQDLGTRLIQWGQQYETVLIDCVTMLLTNGIFDRIGDQDPDTLTKEQVIDQRTDSLAEADMDMRYLIKEYHDGLLLYEISNRTVWEKASKDEEGLANYFKKNKKRYKNEWKDNPRYKGMVYHVKDESYIKPVAKCVKKLKFADWNEALRKTFNGDSIIRIRVEKGLFKKGDNKFVDREVFKVQDVQVDSVKGYPIDAVYGKLLKKPEDYTDVRVQVVADLQDELERLWVADLRKRYSFSVNEEILKTVNKHE